MKKLVLFLTSAALLAGCQHGSRATLPKWTSTEKTAEFPAAGYVVRNNVWGEGPGPQIIWADSPAHWASMRVIPRRPGSSHTLMWAARYIGGSPRFSDAPAASP